MQEKIKEILEKHYSEILTELDEVVDVDGLDLTIKVQHEDFNCKLGG